MKIIIAGAGEVGTYLAKMLSNEDQDIILIDDDQDRLDIIDRNYNLMTLNASTSSIRALKEAGIDETDLYIAVTPFETRNIAIGGIAKKLGAKRTVARIDNYEFMEPSHKDLITSMGVDKLIYPEDLAAEEIITALEHNWARHWGELHYGHLLLLGVKIHSNSSIEGMRIRDIAYQDHYFHIAAIRRNHETIIPGGNDRVLNDDIVYFITSEENSDRLRELCGKSSYNIKRVMVMGGGKIAVRMAMQSSHRFQIKIIEQNPDRAEYLSRILPNCEIELGDARDVDTLRENNIDDYDAFVALSDSSEANILACLTAKEFGIKKTVSEVENLQFFSQAENLNISTVINKKVIASSRIFKLMLDADETNAKSFALNDAEVAELTVHKGAKIANKPVKDLRLPSGMTLAAVIHEGHASLVGGNTQIVPGDVVVVFCLTGTIHKIERWFS